MRERASTGTVAATIGVVWLLTAVLRASSGVAAPLLPPQTTTTTAAPTTTTAPPAVEPAMTEAEAVARLLVLTNDARATHGLAPLVARADIAEIARAWSVQLSNDGALSHNDAYFSDETRRHLDAALLGENVARNSDIDDAHRMLMASPGHRANILEGRFTAVGLSAVSDGVSWWITQDFVQAKARPAAAASPPPPAATIPTSAAPAVAPAPAPAPAPTAPPARAAVPVRAQSVAASAVPAADVDGGTWTLRAAAPVESSTGRTVGTGTAGAAAALAAAVAGLLVVSRRRGGRAPESLPTGDAASTSPLPRSGGFAHA